MPCDQQSAQGSRLWHKARAMEEVFRTNDLVKLSYVQHLLDEAGVAYFVADQHISATEGNIGAFPRRVLVAARLAGRARLALKGVEPG